MARSVSGSQAAEVAGIRRHRGAGGRELLFGGAGRTRENRGRRKDVSVPEERCSVSGENAEAVSLRKARGSADGERVGESGDDTDSFGAGLCKNEAARGRGRSAAQKPEGEPAGGSQNSGSCRGKTHRGVDTSLSSTAAHAH